MPVNEIKCCLCGLRKGLNEYSKTSRRLADPACKRCTAWTETQEPSVIPAPLETGHVSLEEYTGDIWHGEYNTAEDFDLEDLRPQAPITSMASLGLQGDGPVDVDKVLSSSGRMTNNADTQSNASIPQNLGPSDLPPHLKEKINAAASTPSAPLVTSCATSAAGGSGINALPPHLRNKLEVASSISTATTVRNDLAERGKSREVEYTAYAPDGTQHQRTRIPTTVASSAMTDASRDTASQRSSRPSRARAWREAQPQRPPLPQRQLDVTPTPLVGTQKPDSGSDYQRRLTFCNSDDDEDY